MEPCAAVMQALLPNLAKWAAFEAGERLEREVLNDLGLHLEPLAHVHCHSHAFHDLFLIILYI